MDKFKKCPKGHVHDSELEECPFCNGKEIDDELKKLPKKPPGRLKDIKDLAMCYLRGPKI